MFKILPSILLSASFALVGAAQATSLVLEPSVKPLDPALTRLDTDGKSKFEIRYLSIAASDTLLDSTEGEVWQVIAVQASACGNPASKEKSERKNCQALKADCAKAESYAAQFGKHATCSALYTQTTVLLTNDSTGGKRNKVASAPKAKVVKPARKHQHKAAPVVHKKAATSC